MARTAIVVTLALYPLLAACPAAPRTIPLDTAALGETDACFLLVDLQGRTRAATGGDRCETRVSPCSTFKIPHAILALESGAIRNESEVIPWDGTEYAIDAWERDHDLQTAVRYSVVWYFQALARREGRPRVQAFLDRIEYGNRDASGPLESFWIDSTLRISPAEQVEFLRRLYRDELPADADAARIVRQILVQAQDDDWTLSGKTGTCMLGGRRSRGWYVGHVASGGEDMVFATLMEGDDIHGRDAKRATRRILEHAGLIPRP